jgi:uncharacterized membrane protein (DUF106 family)
MLVILIFSIVILLVINLLYRLLIDQDEIVEIKKRIKDLEKESKQFKDDREKTKEYFSKIMDEQKKISKMSLKPMLVSFIVIIIFLPFLSTMYIDHPVAMQPMPNSTVSEGNVTLTNTYFVLKDNNTINVLNYSDRSLVTSCDESCLQEIDGKHWKIYSEKVNDRDVVKFNDVVITSPVNIPIIGKELGWIWWYIILSIPLSILIKKLMGVKM